MEEDKGAGLEDLKRRMDGLPQWERLAGDPGATPETIAMLINQNVTRVEDSYNEREVPVARNPLHDSGCCGDRSSKTYARWETEPETTTVRDEIPGHDYDSRKAIDIINGQSSQKRVEILQRLATLNGELHELIAGKINK